MTTDLWLTPHRNEEELAREPTPAELDALDEAQRAVERADARAKRLADDWFRAQERGIAIRVAGDAPAADAADEAANDAMVALNELRARVNAAGDARAAKVRAIPRRRAA